MGVTAVLALLMTIFAYLAQSPRALLRMGLAGYRLDLRVKLFTGYALASLILMLGFFLAGVPINEGNEVAAAPPTADIVEVVATSANTGAMGALPATAVASPNTLPDTPTDSTTETPSSGAFGGPPANEDDVASTEEPTQTATPEQAGPSATPGADGTVAETAVPATNNGTIAPSPTATATATPLPTATPTPTITPTPINGNTAIINTNGSTLWVRRSPGGQQLVIVQDNDTVILENGRANQGGILWREVRTVNGILGWVQTEFLEE